MTAERKCILCEKEGRGLKDETVVVTLKMHEVCWPCVSEAVDYYREAMKEE